MNIDDGNGKYNIRIAPFAAEPNRYLVEVQRPFIDYDESRPPVKVTCSSFGGSPDEADEYAAALMKAAEMAREMDANFKEREAENAA